MWERGRLWCFREAAVEAFVSARCLGKVSGVRLAAAAVISWAGWEPQDVLQIVRQWVWWGNVSDGEWAQWWALWQLWLAEIGRPLI